MSAVNEKDLKKSPAFLCVAPIPAGFDKQELIDDGATAQDIFDKITSAVPEWTRLGSIIDLTLNEDFGANLIEVKADECDTGTICKLTEPDVNITVTRYECGNPDVFQILTGVPTETAGDDIYSCYVKTCRDLPRFIVKIETCKQPTGTTYLYDASLSGTLSAQYVDIKRAGGLQGSELQFDLNTSGCIVRCVEDYFLPPVADTGK